MARKPKAKKNESPGIGDNIEKFDNLTAQEFEDLSTFYQIKIRHAMQHADTIKAEYAEARGEVNSLVKKMTADIKVTRKEFLEFLTDLDMKEQERTLKLARRQRLYASAGIGTQFDLFQTGPKINDTVDDENEAFEAGRRAFLRGEFGTPPVEIDPFFHQRWLAGYHAEQEKVAAAMGRAETLLAARDNPNAAAKPVDLNAQPAGAEGGEPETGGEEPNGLNPDYDPATDPLAGAEEEPADEVPENPEEAEDPDDAEPIPDAPEPESALAH